MRVFYYQHNGQTYIVCVKGGDARKTSPIYKNNNTCLWLVPGTNEEDER